MGENLSVSLLPLNVLWLKLDNVLCNVKMKQILKEKVLAMCLNFLFSCKG